MGVGFLSAEPLIIERLKKFVPDNVEVRSVDQIKTVADLSQFNETVYSTYSGFDLTENSGKGQLQKIKQNWTVITAVREESNGGEEGILTRAVASPIMDSILLSLLGHKLGVGYDHFRLAPADNQTYSDGFAFYELTFSTIISLKGSVQ